MGIDVHGTEPSAAVRNTRCKDLLKAAIKPPGEETAGIERTTMRVRQRMRRRDDSVSRVRAYFDHIRHDKVDANQKPAVFIPYNASRLCRMCHVSGSSERCALRPGIAAEMRANVVKRRGIHASGHRSAKRNGRG